MKLLSLGSFRRNSSRYTPVRTDWYRSILRRVSLFTNKLANTVSYKVKYEPIQMNKLVKLKQKRFHNQLPSNLFCFSVDRVVFK